MYVEACMEDEDNGIHDIVAETVYIAESVAAEDFISKFNAKLPAFL